MYIFFTVEQEQIQKRTFTNWINAQLSKVNPRTTHNLREWLWLWSLIRLNWGSGWIAESLVSTEGLFCSVCLWALHMARSLIYL